MIFMSWSTGIVHTAGRWVKDMTKIIKLFDLALRGFQPTAYSTMKHMMFNNLTEYACASYGCSNSSVLAICSNSCVVDLILSQGLAYITEWNIAEF